MGREAYTNHGVTWCYIQRTIYDAMTPKNPQGLSGTPKNPSWFKRTPRRQKNPWFRKRTLARGSLNAAKEPLFVRVYVHVRTNHDHDRDIIWSYNIYIPFPEIFILKQ